ncbi:MAG: hypothetical protein UX77_C0005G0002 [Parcubacteria group bacterium GW2011_GWA1_47_11]|uniref:Uncharacterized protein n=1 Tax=Candidatus Colwellbacteria bacterium GWA2_46_10 TaxID=1797684 RepID=A0A1G1YUY7_9BACT|nr:MAG: hypothetical protein UX29_C0009G0031 [Parcubacteria group bacterium GW2011_GWA2_46_10]KKU55973.1 MAG: hypothetical protein UX77_C0005G0002 [Parcubacteria group bacterium GW2011_GWA1_47_11]OGY56134.1 MAG: hypothetical protein A2119_02925 [Candidatus Colwellbacteria bacterium GWA2_46_10]
MRSFIKYLSITTLFSLSLFIGPVVRAQSMDFAQLIVADDVAPEERLAKKIELTTDALKKADERVVEMRTKLEAIKFEDETPELELRNKLIERANEYSAFYNDKLTALAAVQTLEEVDLLIDEIIAYREGAYTIGAKEILEFTLVYSYTPSVLTLADERLENILKDVERLEGLKLIEPSTFVSKTDESKATLQKAHDLQTQAATLIMENYATSLLVVPVVPEVQPLEAVVTTTEALPALLEVTPRSLAEQSLTEVKKLYELFIETGEKVGETLGIN